MGKSTSLIYGNAVVLAVERKYEAQFSVFAFCIRAATRGAT